MAIGGGGGLQAGFGFFGLQLGQPFDALLRFGQGLLGGGHVQAAAVAVQNGFGAVLRQGGLQHAGAGGHHGRQAECPRQDGGVGGGAAPGGAEALDAGGVDLGGDGGGEVIGQQDGVGGPALRRVAALVALAQQVAQHALAHVLQVGRAGRQGGVRQPFLFFDALVQALLPGPGRAMALHHQFGHVAQQAGVTQQFEVGLEDVGLFGLALLFGAGDEGGQLLLGIGQCQVQFVGGVGHALEVVFHVQFV